MHSLNSGKRKNAFVLITMGKKFPNGPLEGSGVIGLILEIKGKLLFTSKIWESGQNFIFSMKVIHSLSVCYMIVMVIGSGNSEVG